MRQALPPLASVHDLQSVAQRSRARISSILTDHNSGHGQQERSDEGRSPDRQTQSQVGHLYETGQNNIVPHLLTSPVEVFTFTLIPNLMMWKQHKAWDCSNGCCVKILFLLQGRSHFTCLSYGKNVEKPYSAHDLSRPTDHHGIIGCLSLQRVHLQIAGQGDILGHRDTIEMVIAPLFCLKLQNDFVPH